MHCTSTIKESAIKFAVVKVRFVSFSILFLRLMQLTCTTFNFYNISITYILLAFLKALISVVEFTILSMYTNICYK